MIIQLSRIQGESIENQWRITGESGASGESGVQHVYETYQLYLVAC